MQLTELRTDTDLERVVECIDEDSGYHGIIAVHSPVLGPAVGGTRLCATALEEAMADVSTAGSFCSLCAPSAGEPTHVPECPLQCFVAVRDGD